jgi:regulator of replication initiation timing
MGKLTESLKTTANQLNQVKQGISQMRELGQELSNNTVQIAEAALRTGYAYAKAEAENEIAQSGSSYSLKSISPATTNILALNELHSYGETYWTKELLRTHFGSCDRAYRYLRDHGVKLSRKSWETVVNAFNGTNKSSDNEPSIIQRIDRLEQAILQQNQRISMIEEKLNEALQQFRHIAITSENL